MSGIAEVLLSLGFRVSGTDLKESDVVGRLRKLGAAITIGHASESLPSDADLVVYSSAVSMENPEVVEAKRRGLPVVRRAEVLAELMRLKYGVGVAGSHGKTSTTSMTGAILEEAGLDPTIIIGGQVVALGTGGKFGRGDFLVAETDESDRSFLLLKPTVAIVTNIDNEHLVAYDSLEHLQQSFRQFIDAVPFYGLAVMCVDDPVVRAMVPEVKRRVVTYGLTAGADISADSISAGRYGMSFRVLRKGEPLVDIRLPMLGRHFVQNALASIAVALEFGIEPAVVQRALVNFGGVRRRLEVMGEASGVVVVNDYGHHPTEIRASIAAIRECFGKDLGRLFVVFQPHRYTRTEASWDDFLTSFDGADRLICTDIYSAGEAEISGITGLRLCDAVVHGDKTFVSSIADSVPFVANECAPGDVVLCLGAGSIGNLPVEILQALEGTRAKLAVAVGYSNLHKD